MPEGKLRKSVAVNGYDDRVSLYGCALYSEERTLDFHFAYEFSGGGSTFGSDDGAIYQSRQMTVTARTLDTLLAEVPQVEVMKIDVEGAEPHVLLGAQKLLGRSRYLTLIMEFHEQSVAAVVNPRQYLEQLAAEGFTISLIEVPGVTKPLQPQACLERLNGQLGYLFLQRI
jgi:FkbM family methyltransferase